MDLTWDTVSGDLTAYRVYYDLAGKLQFVATSTLPQYTDTGLKPDSQVCYAVTSWNDCNGDDQVDAGEESARSDAISETCATPTRH